MNKKEYHKKYRINNIDKIKEQKKEYYKNNKDRVKEYNREYRENNKDKIRECDKKWIENNKEKVKEYQKEWRENNVEKRKECGKEYYKNNGDKIRERSKEYCENNKDKIREYMKEYYKNNADKKKEYRKSNAIYNTFVSQISYAEEIRKDPKDKKLLQVRCTYCGKWYNPTISNIQNRIAALEGRGSGEQRLYCSKECKRLCPTYRKRKYSAEETNTKQLSREVQAELRQMVFERDEWTCIKCGETKGLQCHHIEGIQWNPIESADIDICVTFCVKCHREAHKDKGCRY